MIDRPESEPTPLDDAARAGWLYYVAGLTQDQIARELGTSRQRAQRLVSRAISERLIHVRLEHRVSGCLHLEAALIRRFGLKLARVAPSLGSEVDPLPPSPPPPPPRWSGCCARSGRWWWPSAPAGRCAPPSRR